MPNITVYVGDKAYKLFLDKPVTRRKHIRKVIKQKFEWMLERDSNG